MKTQSSAVRYLNRARWDNHLVVMVWGVLGTVGCFGVYGTLDTGRPPVGGGMPHEMVARKPQRLRRREISDADTVGGGLKARMLTASN